MKYILKIAVMVLMLGPIFAHAQSNGDTWKPLTETEQLMYVGGIYEMLNFAGGRGPKISPRQHIKALHETDRVRETFTAYKIASRSRSRHTQE